MTRSGKKSGNGLLRWIFGLIFILVAVAGINSGIKDISPAEEIQKDSQKAIVHQTKEADLIETDTRAEGVEGIESGQYRGFESNELSDNISDNGPDNSIEDDISANGKIGTASLIS